MLSGGVHLCTGGLRSLCSCGKVGGRGGKKITVFFKLWLEDRLLPGDCPRPFHRFSPLTHIPDSQLKLSKDQLCQQSFPAQSPIHSLAQSHYSKGLEPPFGPVCSPDTASWIICPEPEARREAPFLDASFPLHYCLIF